EVPIEWRTAEECVADRAPDAPCLEARRFEPGSDLQHAVSGSQSRTHVGSRKGRRMNAAASGDKLPLHFGNVCSKLSVHPRPVADARAAPLSRSRRRTSRAQA